MLLSSLFFFWLTTGPFTPTGPEAPSLLPACPRPPCPTARLVLCPGSSPKDPRPLPGSSQPFLPRPEASPTPSQHPPSPTPTVTAVLTPSAPNPTPSTLTVTSSSPTPPGWNSKREPNLPRGFLGKKDVLGARPQPCSIEEGQMDNLASPIFWPFLRQHPEFNVPSQQP